MDPSSVQHQEHTELTNQQPDIEQTMGTDVAKQNSPTNNSESPISRPSDQPQSPPSQRLTFSPNFEPPAPIQRKFEYFPHPRIDWFKFVGELEGSGDQISQIASNQQNLSAGPLSVPRSKQYSVFESQPAAYTYDPQKEEFPISTPSDQAKGIHSLICDKQKFDFALPLSVSLVCFIAKLALFICCFSSLSNKSENLSYISLFSVLETAIWFNYAFYYKQQQQDFQNHCINTLLDRSASLAVALPKLLISECGPSKFLKQQIGKPTLLEILQISMAILSLLFVAFSTSVSSGNVFNFYKMLPNVSTKKIQIMFIGLSIISTSLQFVFALFQSYQYFFSLQLMKTSICCNLRGFLLTQNYALDYSEVHQLDEGLSYMFGSSSPTIFVPYQSVVDCYLHLEPFSARFQYSFTKNELQQLDSKYNERAQQVLRRGFDQSTMNDVLVWCVYQLESGLKIWVPLSLTQLQSSNVVKSVMFGFQGGEVSKICRMVKATMQECEEDDGCEEKMGQFEEVAGFCDQYQKLRSQSIAEEALHLDCLDKVFTAGTEEE